jgi:hypothetical protein
MSKTKVDKQRSFRYDLGDGLWYDNQPDTYSLDLEGIRKIEKLRNCRYVCEWNTTDSSGRISTYPMLIFWNDVAHPQGSNWMALFKDGGHNGWFVRDGIAASRVPILAGVSNNGQAMFSKNRHDYRQSHDGSITLDGGRDYTRIIGTPPKRWVWLLPQDGEIRIIDESAAKLLCSAFDKKQDYAI